MNDLCKEEAGKAIPKILEYLRSYPYYDDMIDNLDEDSIPDIGFPPIETYQNEYRDNLVKYVVECVLKKNSIFPGIIIDLIDPYKTTDIRKIIIEYKGTHVIYQKKEKEGAWIEIKNLDLGTDLEHSIYIESIRDQSKILIL